MIELLRTVEEIDALRNAWLNQIRAVATLRVAVEAAQAIDPDGAEVDDHLNQLRLAEINATIYEQLLRVRVRFPEESLPEEGGENNAAEQEADPPAAEESEAPEAPNVIDFSAIMERFGKKKKE